MGATSLTTAAKWPLLRLVRPNVSRSERDPLRSLVA